MSRIDPQLDHWLDIERRFTAPVSLVWRLWTDAEWLKRWFGPKDFTCPSYSLDLRPGGRYRGLIRAEQYGDSWFGGAFREILPQEKLVMSFAWEQDSGHTDPNEITLTWREVDGVTIQHFRQGPFADSADRDSHLGGWGECIDKQAAYLGVHGEN